MTHLQNLLPIAAIATAVVLTGGQVGAATQAETDARCIQAEMLQQPGMSYTDAKATELVGKAFANQKAGGFLGTMVLLVNADANLNSYYGSDLGLGYMQLAGAFATGLTTAITCTVIGLLTRIAKEVARP